MKNIIVELLEKQIKDYENEIHKLKNDERFKGTDKSMQVVSVLRDVIVDLTNTINKAKDSKC